MNPFAFNDVALPGAAALVSQLANFQLASEMLDYLDNAPITVASVRDFKSTHEWKLLERAIRERIASYESICMNPDLIRQHASLEQAACVVSSAAQTRSVLLDLVELPDKLIADLEAKEDLEKESTLISEYTPHQNEES